MALIIHNRRVSRHIAAVNQGQKHPRPQPSTLKQDSPQPTRKIRYFNKKHKQAINSTQTGENKKTKKNLLVPNSVIICFGVSSHIFGVIINSISGIIC